MISKTAETTPATYWLIIINLVVFLIVKVVSLFYLPFSAILAFKPLDITNASRIWSMISSIFLHLGPAHLFVNMVSLFFLGSFLEKLIKARRFLGVYIVSGIIGTAFYAWLGEPATSVMGASGAIFGVAGTLAVLTPKMPVHLFFIPVTVPMFAGVFLLILTLWLLTALFGLPVANISHAGGLLVGLLYARYLQYIHPEKTKMVREHYQ